MMLAFLALSAMADDQDSIDYRQHVMKTLQAQSASIGMVLQHKAPAENLATHAKLLSLAAGTAKKAFDTKAAGGNANASVWASAADFAKRMDAMIGAADELAKTSTAAAAAPKYQAVLTTCKGCHDTYMAPKK